MSEIAKAMTRDAAVVVMDEPNSSLSPSESERMFEMIDKLKAQGTALVYVSHKLEEVLRVADRITVFRDGGLVGTIDKEGADEDKLIQMMVGRELQREYVARRCGDRTLLEVRNISGRGFDDVSFDLKQGEILCFSGLMGAGRSEVMKAFMGADSWHGGEVVFDGKPVRFNNPKQALEAGVVMLQEDRKRLSLFMNLPIKFNMEIGVLPMLQTHGIVNGSKANASTRSYVKSLDIKLASLAHPVKSLSGGNQQKTILARWLAVKPRILILDEPTHGVDVGAKSEIYRLIRELADEGMSIILISSELPEVLAMADRVVVMCEGSVKAILPRDEGLDEEKIMRFAAGSVKGGQNRAG